MQMNPIGMIGGAIGAMGSMTQAQGQAEAYVQQAELAQQRAYLGKIKARQTDTAYREELTTTLSNIDAIRAAANTDPWSPTAMAIKNNETRISGRARRTAVLNIMSQVDADETAADIYASNARYALMGGTLGAMSSMLRGFS